MFRCCCSATASLHRRLYFEKVDVFFVLGALDFCFLCIVSVVKKLGKHQIVLLFTLGHANLRGGYYCFGKTKLWIFCQEKRMYTNISYIWVKIKWRVFYSQSSRSMAYCFHYFLQKRYSKFGCCKKSMIDWFFLLCKIKVWRVLSNVQ